MSISLSSDIGMRRSNNQDSYAVSLAADFEDWLQRGHLFVIADGMGAHAAGELASKLAAEHVSHIYRKHPEASPPEGLREAIREANQEIHRRGEANLDFHNMGTTCSSLLLLPQGAIAGHVGDSRVYRLRGRLLEQLTFDHSLVWEMRAAGQLTSSDAEATVPKNVITRSLGPQANVKVDLEGPFALQPNDTFLLCSDGLTGRVDDAEIAATLHLLRPQEAATFLINLANLRGGPDNITVMVIRVAGKSVLAQLPALPALELEAAGHPAKSLHPAWWIGLGVSGLMALTLLAAGKVPWASLPAGVFAILLLAILTQWFHLFAPEGVRLGTGQMLGKGPHRRTQVKPEREFIGQLLSNFRTARSSSAAEGWKVDWTEFDQACEQAERHCDAERYPESLQALLIASVCLSGAIKDHATA